MKDDQVYSESTVRTLRKHFQGCLVIFSDIQRYLGISIFIYTHRRATSEDGDRPPFFENRKKCFEFWKKYYDCVYFTVKLSIQNVVVWLRRFLLVLLAKCSSKSPPLPWKLLVASLHSGTILFAKRFIVNVWQCYAFVSFSIADQ